MISTNIYTNLKADWFLETFNSPYYNRLYAEKSKESGLQFIHRLIDRYKPAAGSRILHSGSAHGDYTVALTQPSTSVTGIDPAKSNVDLAQQFAADNLQFFLHDIRLPFWIHYFDYAFSLFSSFGYFRTERENSNSIRTIAHSLRTGGIFVLDYLNVHYEEDHLIYKEEVNIDDVVYVITSWMDETHFYKKITVEDEQLSEPVELIDRRVKLSLGDINDMLAFYDLQIQHVFGDYELGTYDIKKSPRLIIEAKKIH